MDGYPMPVADLLVDAAAGHQIISLWIAMEVLMQKVDLQTLVQKNLTVAGIFHLPWRFWQPPRT